MSTYDDNTPVFADTPASTPPSGVATPPRGARLSTVVWGVVIAAIGAGILAWVQGYRFDLQLAAIGLLVACGAALVIGSFTRSTNRTGP